MNTPMLETERLILRKFTENDLEALFLILKDEEVNRFLPWFPMKNLEETREFYEERYAAQYAKPQGYAYAICLKEDGYPHWIYKSRYGGESRLWIRTSERILAQRYCD